MDKKIIYNEDEVMVYDEETIPNYKDVLNGNITSKYKIWNIDINDNYIRSPLYAVGEKKSYPDLFFVGSQKECYQILEKNLERLRNEEIELCISPAASNIESFLLSFEISRLFAEHLFDLLGLSIDKKSKHYCPEESIIDCIKHILSKDQIKLIIKEVFNKYKEYNKYYDDLCDDLDLFYNMEKKI